MDKLEALMKENHFEILLEEIRGNSQLAFEGIDVINQRMGRMESDIALIKNNINQITTKNSKFEQSIDLLQSIVSDHEARIQ
jgi:hypothetical protein